MENSNNQKVIELIEILNDKYISEFETQNISLITGVSGLALTNYLVGTTTNNDKYISFSEKIINDVINKVNESNFTISNFFSYCNGFSGIFTAINYLHSKGLIVMDLDEELSEIEEFLYEHGLKSLQFNKSDFLHGGMGVLFYFTKRLPNKRIENYMHSMIKAYYDSCVKDEKGFRILNTVLNEREENEFDLGLAHGLSGHIIIFCELSKKIANPLIDEIINNLLKYVESNERTPNSENNKYSTFFPVSVVEGINKENVNLEFFNSRLAWCYGDLNYSIMYFKLYEYSNLKVYYDKAIIIAKETLKRNNPNESKVNSPFFCHGAAGLVCIYDMIYNKTKIEEFKSASNYWRDYILSEFDDKMTEVINLRPYCFLEGGSGVILAYLSDKNNELAQFFILN